MTDPINLKNVRLAYPTIPSRVDRGQDRHPITVTMQTKYNPLTFCWMMSHLMGEMVPHVTAFVGYDPQKLLPPPGPENRPMSLWDKETLLRMSQAVMDGVYSVSGIADLFPKPLKEGHIESHEPTFKHYAAVVTTHHVDTGELEALLADPHIRCVIIDFDSPGGEIRPPNRQLDIYAAGTFAHLERNIYHRPPQVAPKNQPSYHRHDPTKKHRRRK